MYNIYNLFIYFAKQLIKGTWNGDQWQIADFMITCNLLSKVTLHHWRRSGIVIVNFEHISHLVLVFLLLILNM